MSEIFPGPRQIKTLATMTSELTEADLQAVLAERDACRERGDRLGYARSLMALQHVVKWVRSDNAENPFERAQTLSVEALEVFRELADEAGIIKALCAASQQRPPDVKEAMLAEALSLAEQRGNPKEIVYVLAATARSLGLTDRAKSAEVHRRVLAMYEELCNRAGMASTLFSLAVSTIDDRAGWEYALRAAEIYKELGRAHESARAYQLALMPGERIAELSEQLRVAKEGLALAQSCGYRSAERGFYLRLAKISARLGEVDAAATYRRWHDEIEAADGLTPEERKKLRKEQDKWFRAMAKQAGFKDFGEKPVS